MAVDPLVLRPELRAVRPPLPPAPHRLRAALAVPRAAVAVADLAAVATAAVAVPAGAAGALHALGLAALLLRGGPLARLSSRARNEVRSVASCSVAALLGPALLALFSYIPGAVLVQALAAVPLVVTGRAGAYAVLRGLRRRGHLVATTAVVGEGRLAVELSALLVDHPELGMAPVGPLARCDGRVLPVIRDAGALADAITSIGVDRVIVVGGEHDPGIDDVVLHAADLGVDTWVLPGEASLGGAEPGDGGDDVGGVALVPVEG